MDKHEEGATTAEPREAAERQAPETAENREAETKVPAEELRTQLEQLGAELESAREQHLRAVAELENVRRRAARDVENAHKYGVERFAAEILTVKDAMEMGLQSVAETESESASADGFRATLKLLDQCLAKFGISQVDPQGEPFDPQYHEAMSAQPSAAHEPGTVLMVVQKGYRIHDRLLRPARVIVSRAADGEDGA